MVGSRVPVFFYDDIPSSTVQYRYNAWGNLQGNFQVACRVSVWLEVAALLDFFLLWGTG